MKVCIAGAGAIGGFIGARLAAAKACDLSALARGATLAALRTHGWRLQQGDTLLQAPARAGDNAVELGAQDVVIIAVKGQALAAVARQIAPMIGPHTVILPAMNGVPWWFCQGLPAIGDEPLASVDPGGAITAALPYAQVLGCVVHASTSTPEPGLVSHKMGNGLIIGEPAGGLSDRANELGALLRLGGFDVTVSADVRYDIWYKLWGNMTLNPVSAITGATAERILDDQLVAEFCRAAMREAAVIGERIACRIAENGACGTIFGYPGDGINGVLGALATGPSTRSNSSRCGTRKWPPSWPPPTPSSPASPASACRPAARARPTCHRPVRRQDGPHAGAGDLSARPRAVARRPLPAGSQPAVAVPGRGPDYVHEAAVPSQVRHLLDRAMRIARPRAQRHRRAGAAQRPAGHEAV
jgi:2-dehydropantoate 2-reductase